MVELRISYGGVQVESNQCLCVRQVMYNDEWDIIRGGPHPHVGFTEVKLIRKDWDLPQFICEDAIDDALHCIPKLNGIQGCLASDVCIEAVEGIIKTYLVLSLFLLGSANRSKKQFGKSGNGADGNHYNITAACLVGEFVAENIYFIGRWRSDRRILLPSAGW